MERGKKFYSDAFGWTWEQHVPEYALFSYKTAVPKSKSLLLAFPSPLRVLANLFVLFFTFYAFIGAVRGDMYLHAGPIANEGCKIHLWSPSVSEGVKRAVNAGATVVKDTFEIG